eukprot:m.227393 g.227393  ORF g.227393 m.227393 type:complete len:458 (-) comp15972_c0_seq2:300-1673(-)
MSFTVCKAVTAFLTFVFVLVICIVIPLSVTRVSDDEACQVFYSDGRKIVSKESSGLVFVGPNQEKYCLTRTTQHLIFSDENTGLERLITARTQGLEVELEVDVEYRLKPGKIWETADRIGYDSPQARMLRTCRAEIRNVASLFPVEAFLSGTRANISETMGRWLHETFNELDGVFIDIINVNLLHIQVYKPFEEKFQEVENKRLQQVVARENTELVIQQEVRKNQTEHINAQAQRDQRLQEANSLIIKAQLEQEKLVTEAETQHEQDKIEAESDRQIRTIRAQTVLEETVAQRQLTLQELDREALQKFTVAETARQNMESVARGNIERALSEARRDIQLANIERTKQIEALVKLTIEKNLEVFNINLTANVDGQRIRQNGVAQAREAEKNVKKKTREFELLQDKLNMSDKAVVSLLLYRALQKSPDKKVLLDYVKQPLMTELGQVNAPTTTEIDIKQ